MASVVVVARPDLVLTFGPCGCPPIEVQAKVKGKTWKPVRPKRSVKIRDFRDNYCL